VQTDAVPRGDENHDDVSLEVIDLEPELGARPEPRSPKAVRWSTLAVFGAAALAVAGTAVVAAHHDDGSAPLPRRAETVGRFYPAPDDRDEARLVLPSGVTVVLSDAQRTLGGLGATFAGSIGSIGFRVSRAAPSDLFDTLGPGPIVNAVEVAGAHARAPDVAEYGGRLAVMSSGPWTLVAFLSDDESTAVTQMNELSLWELHPTADGTVVRARNEFAGDASVVLVDDSDRIVRRVELTDDNCVGQSQRTEAALGEAATGYWCQEGIYVRITGPEPFVADALAALRVDIRRDRSELGSD